MIAENLLFRKLTEADKDIFIELRMAFLKEEFQMTETEQIQIKDNLVLYFSEHIFYSHLAEHHVDFLVSILYMNNRSFYS